MFFGDFEKKMDEEFFATLQRIYPWFNGELLLSGIKPLDDDIVNSVKTFEDIKKQNINSFDAKRIIFAKIFKEDRDIESLDMAEKICWEMLDNLPPYEKIKECIKSKKNIEQIVEYASLQILLGTVYAYKKDYVKSVYHFFAGIKEEAVNLNDPYCHFIKYVVSKIEDMPKEKEENEFSAEKIIGFKIDKSDRKIFAPGLAEDLVSKLKGKKGEVVVAYRAVRSMFGLFERQGSVYDKESETHIDRYKTFLIDRKYNIKEVIFYISNYIDGTILKENLVVQEGFEVDF